MIARSLIAIGLLVTGMLLGRYLWPQPLPESPMESVADIPAAASYVCPMHPDVVSDEPGACPVCGMALVQAKRSVGEDMEAAGVHEHAHAAPYVCSMHPDVVGDEPGACPVCGMALVQAKHGNAEPAQDTEADAQQRPTVRIAPEVIHNLGVKTEPVIRTTLMRRIDTPGFVQQIQPGQTRRVTAPFDARIAAVRFTAGQWIEAGKPLLVLESETLRETEQAHLALLAHTEAQPAASVAQTNAGGTPATQPLTIEESRRALTQLGLTPEDIRKLEDAREPSAQLTLYAPFAARVDNPQTVTDADVKQGALLFELTGMARASVLANAFQRDAAWIQTGQPVEIRLPHVSGEVWAGVVNQGAVSIDPDSQNIGVRLSFSAPTHMLKSAMYVVATIMGDARRDTLAVPQDALIRTEAEDRVIVAHGNGRFSPVSVRVGIETGGQVEILSGISEGDEVVVSAQFLIDSESSLQASFLRMSGSMSDQAAE